MGPFLDLLIGAPWWVLILIFALFVAAIVFVALVAIRGADAQSRPEILRAVGDMIWPWRRSGHR